MRVHTVSMPGHCVYETMSSVSTPTEQREHIYQESNSRRNLGLKNAPSWSTHMDGLHSCPNSQYYYEYFMIKIYSLYNRIQDKEGGNATVGSYIYLIWYK